METRQAETTFQWSTELKAQCLKQWNGPLGDLDGRDVQLVWTGAQWTEVVRAATPGRKVA